MPRRRRLTPASVPVHVIQRGNNRTAMFRELHDYVRYRAFLDDARRRTDCAIHAYVLMTNHVHLLVTPSQPRGVSKMMQFLGRRYVGYFNYHYRRTGALWEGRFRSAPIESERYFLTCARYIELNPVRAGIVKHPREYSWSSFRANADGVAESLIETHPLYDALGRDPVDRARTYAQLFGQCVDDDDVAAIRRATHRGLPLISFPPELGSESGL